MPDDPKTYRLETTAAAKLRELLLNSARQVRYPIESQERLINDLYSGRDVNGGGLSPSSLSNLLSLFPDRAVSGSWMPPELGVNIMLSRLQQILSALIPSKPTFHAKPRVPRAAKLVETQNQLSQFATDHGDLRGAMKRAAFQGMMAPYFAVKLEVKPKQGRRGDWEAFRYRAIEARDCGYEPQDRRFSWHTYKKQFGDLSAKIQAAVKNPKPQPWDLVRVTEVYHEGFRHGHKSTKSPQVCPVSIYLAPQPTERGQDRDIDEASSDRDFGEYVHTYNVQACPIIFGSFNEPAPGEDVPPVEVVSWLPHIRKILQTWGQIAREAKALNTIHLIRKGALGSNEETILSTLTNQGIPSETIYLTVDADDSENGVSHTWRPVEQSDNLGSLLAVFQNDLQFFDDMIGLSPMERGIASNPRKSATEASSITAAGSRRNRARLEVIAETFAKLFQTQFMYQHEAWGNAVTIPTAGLEVRLDVPNPTTAQFAFEVDPVELGHLTKQGDADALFNGLTVISNTLATFQGAIPKPVREMLRRVLHAQGVPDADALIDAPTLDAGPEDRFMELLLHGTPIQVGQQDQHQMFVGYYEAQSQKLPPTHPAQMDLQQVIMEHNVFIRQAAAAAIDPAAQPQVVPGVGPGGLDNQMAAQVAAGQAPNFAQAPGAIQQI